MDEPQSHQSMVMDKSQGPGHRVSGSWQLPLAYQFISVSSDAI